MPHVDEGMLHALLDGELGAMEPGRAAAVEAHLEGCAECRALAEEAAALRERAGEVLDVLEPDVAPDFEEVLVRAGAAGPASGHPPLARQARWTRRLAWAATVVIALGTGYLIRDRLVPEPAASFRVEAPAPGDAAPDLGPHAPAAPGRGVERPADRAPLVEGGGAGAPAAPREEAEETVPGLTWTATDADGAEPQAAQRIAVAPAPPLGARVEQEPLPVQEMMFAPAPPAPGARVITPEQAADVLDAPFLVLPRAEVTLVTVEPAEDGVVVVSLQRVSEDVVIRVSQGPEREPEPLGRSRDSRVMSAAPAGAARMRAAAGESTGTSSVRVRVSGAELVLEGPLPREVLELLGGAAAPYARPR